MIDTVKQKRRAEKLQQRTGLHRPHVQLEVVETTQEGHVLSEGREDTQERVATGQTPGSRAAQEDEDTQPLGAEEEQKEVGESGVG